MKMRLTSPRNIGVLLIVAAALVGSACSGSDDKADEDAKSDKTTTTDTAPPSTMTDEDYDAALATFATALEQAGDSLCAMGEAQQSIPQAAPANPAQMEATMVVYTDMLRTYAKALPDDPTTVATLNSTADALAAEAKDAGYPVDFLTPATEEEQPKALTTPEYLAANQALSTKFQADCAPATSEGAAPDASVPEATTTTTP